MTETYNYNPPSLAPAVPELGDGVAVSGKWLHIQVGNIAVQADIDEIAEVVADYKAGKITPENAEEVDCSDLTVIPPYGSGE